MVCGSLKGSPLAGFDAGDLFRKDLQDDKDVAKNITAAFLILLCGNGHGLYDSARDYLSALQANERWGSVARFMMEGAALIEDEIENLWGRDITFRMHLEEAVTFLANRQPPLGRDAIERVWRIFFPEGADSLMDPEGEILSLRAERHVRITKPNPFPISNPAREILFLSNLLVTTPADPDSVEQLPYEDRIVRELKRVGAEEQRYWYDHPIQIGVLNDNNEAVYGLRGLDRAMAFEKEKGIADARDRLICLLSVSVTHEGLHGIVKEYLRAVYESSEPFNDLSIFLFSEDDTDRIKEEILLPAIKKYMGVSDASSLDRVFGVDGDYGRHYSFLKAMSAFWKVLIDPEVKGSFKLDLDQVFDQRALLKETAHTALEHFKTPLWGATGEDAAGNPLDLGMMAGALVNAQDVEKSLFTPDVPLADPAARGEALLFYSPFTMGISTRAEMMTRYDSESLDGVNRCIQRIHVTGGTTAALIEAIRKYRPFTPSFIGRAEDQAYLMGTLFQNQGANLRYLHRPGLIMRHDKHGFAGEAIEGAKVGKYVGDLVRVLFFSFYARALPWPDGETKKVLDPFTGCFISRLPFTVVYLRLAFRLALMFSQDDAKQDAEGLQLLRQAAGRLAAVIGALNREPNPLISEYRLEKEGWDLFYDVLEHLEKALADSDPFALNLRNRARIIVRECGL